MPKLRARLPVPMLQAIDRAAESEAHGNRSDLVRALLAEGLKARGLWPPKIEEDRPHAR